ncbi:MAG: hypothetical protein QOI47_2166, partial [Actinomycetota bacterium]|nr:hypothetical protein [Actinomycetota bacterium]
NPDTAEWGVTKRVAIGVFRAGELEKAVSLWPQLLEGWNVSTYVEYCRAVDHHLRELELVPGSTVLLAPIEVKHFVKWCAKAGLDSAAPESRSTYAAEVATRGRVQAWPPAPGKRCWCGRDQAYESCCGA